MIKHTYADGGRNSIEYRAEVPMNVMPKIAREYWEDGFRYYRSDDGRLFDADRFDNYWLCKYRPAVQSKRSKGVNPNSFTALMYDQI